MSDLSQTILAGGELMSRGAESLGAAYRARRADRRQAGQELIQAGEQLGKVFKEYGSWQRLHAEEADIKALSDAKSLGTIQGPRGVATAVGDTPINTAAGAKYRDGLLKDSEDSAAQDIVNQYHEAQTRHYQTQDEKIRQEAKQKEEAATRTNAFLDSLPDDMTTDEALPQIMLAIADGSLDPKKGKLILEGNLKSRAAAAKQAELQTQKEADNDAKLAFTDAPPMTIDEVTGEVRPTTMDDRLAAARRVPGASPAVLKGLEASANYANKLKVQKQIADDLIQVRTEAAQADEAHRTFMEVLAAAQADNMANIRMNEMAANSANRLLQSSDSIITKTRAQIARIDAVDVYTDEEKAALKQPLNHDIEIATKQKKDAESFLKTVAASGGRPVKSVPKPGSGTNGAEGPKAPGEMTEEEIIKELLGK